MPGFPRQERLLLAQQCLYIAPDDLSFEGLVPSQGTETVRIRFRRRRETTLEIPLSAEDLALLAQCLAPLHGLTPPEIPDAMQELRQTVWFLDD
jgi:hypothetical protein